jgi:hypothetical protein
MESFPAHGADAQSTIELRSGSLSRNMCSATDASAAEVVFEGIHCTLTIRRPSAGVVLAVFKGPDVGEFGDSPFQELAKDLAHGLPIELFVDARECLGASINVSNEWAQWMCSHRSQLHRVNILCGSRYLEVTVGFVRRFTQFGDRLRIYTEHDAFYLALTSATSAR